MFQENRFPTDTPAWSALKENAERWRALHMRDQFKADPERQTRFSAEGAGLYLDYSKNRIDGDDFSRLINLAQECGVEERRNAMFGGAAINVTEGRAVLHTALRMPPGSSVLVGGKNVIPEVQSVLQAMGDFSDKVRGGRYSVTGGKITHVVNIGIGGSDLGPAMTTIALAPFHDGPKAIFVSNIDGADMADCLASVPVETTLFIIASKTFTTAETMTNAKTAQAAVVAVVGKDKAGKHFAALSTNLEATRAFGIEDERTFGFWDWVGGRYSIWSAIGLSLMMAIGRKNFAAFLAGAHAMDEHFRTCDLDQNLPVILAMLGIWYRNFLGFGSHAVLPYDQRLARFPAYLQQLDMESNGKSITLASRNVEWETGPIVWGEPGTNGQHAFYQLIHQGTDIIPVDFLLAANPQHDLVNHHRMLIANCLAQSEALMCGKTLDEVTSELQETGLNDDEIKRLAPHKVFSGNRPSNTLVYKTLDPATLGSLVALYEHKVFVQGTVWNINSFDQWGVELGKVLATGITDILDGKARADNKDASTRGLIGKIQAMQK